MKTQDRFFPMVLIFRLNFSVARVPWLIISCLVVFSWHRVLVLACLASEGPSDVCCNMHSSSVNPKLNSVYSVSTLATLAVNKL
mmetsp:Transcript_22081/g.45152  ORF Transcript_22081/g.45152 Transcript_22081/m.45152 type:complete len:84 (+) Transcript_22081:698-949(+)